MIRYLKLAISLFFASAVSIVFPQQNQKMNWPNIAIGAKFHEESSTINVTILNLSDHAAAFGHPASYVGAYSYHIEFRNKTKLVELKRRDNLIISMDGLKVHGIGPGEFITLNFDLLDKTWDKSKLVVDEFLEFRVVYSPPSPSIKALVNDALFEHKVVGKWVAMKRETEGRTKQKNKKKAPEIRGHPSKYPVQKKFANQALSAILENDLNNPRNQHPKGHEASSIRKMVGRKNVANH